MIKYTKHALTRLEERNIAKENVEELLDKPDYILKSKLKTNYTKTCNRLQLYVDI